MRLRPVGRLSGLGHGLAVAAILWLSTATGVAREVAGDDPWGVCLAAIAEAERAAKLPRHLLHAVALAESGRRHPESGAWTPWPWAINNAGAGYFLDSLDEAVAAVQGLRAQGETNIDVGCMQVNLQFHPTAFDSLHDAFDPAINAGYAAGLLRALFRQTGSWIYAVQKYHSGKFRNNFPYRQRVMTLWSQLRGRR